MPRRPGLRPAAAPSSGLALVLCILIAFAALLSPAAADTPGAVPAESTVEGASAETTPETAAAEAEARKAARLLRRSERKAERAAPSPPEQSSAPSTPAAGGAPAASTKATRRAERVAEKTARREAAAGSKGASSHAVAPAAAKGTGKKHEREEGRRSHEEQRRLREEERRASGHETKKERQARVAREASEASLRGQGIAARSGTGPAAASAAAATTGLGTAATPEVKLAAVAAGSAAHGVAGGKSSRPRSRRVTHTGVVPLSTQPSGFLAAGAAAAGPVPVETRAKHSAPSRHAAPTRSSPLVTTVTRIIGVIPVAVWLLIGALALAALAFATSSRLAQRRARRLERQRRDLLEDVGLLQAALLPELPARLGALATTAAYRPASGPGAGGDFYDVFALPEGLVAVLVGDVSGHGRDALPHTTLLRYTLRAYLEAGLSPREALRAAAPALERQLGGSFATVVLATYDPRERQLTYSCAGHPHPLLKGLDPEDAIIAASAPPIGAGRPTGTRQTVVSVPGASLVAFYTDGVIEARVEEELYGQARLSAQLELLGAEVSAAALLDRVTEQTDRRPDDMAACILEIAGSDQAPRIVSEQIELDGREAGHARASRFLAAAGVTEPEIGRVLSSARAIAADHGSALLTIEKEANGNRLTLTHDNVAPLRARALARTQEVAL